MDQRLVAVLILAAAACGKSTEPDYGIGSTRFVSPIVGRPMAELFYGAYIDEGGHDYHCGVKYYHGHAGTDILLRSFRVQDSGVSVIAAAPGEVAGVHDGEPDRNTVNSASRAWNYVSIRHADGLLSYYGHLRNGSLKVSVGQQVTTGTPLGLVGSSGNSNWPHLHFEVNGGAERIDPWAGTCGPGSGLWQSQLAYQDEFRVLDSGILDRRSDGLADLLERPPDSDPVRASDGVVSFWAELFNVQAAPLRTEFYAPDGSLAGSINYPQFTTYSISMALVTLPLPAGSPPGRYTVVLLARPLGGGTLSEVTRKSFTLTGSLQARRSPGPQGQSRMTLELFEPGGDGPRTVARTQR